MFYIFFLFFLPKAVVFLETRFQALFLAEY